MGLSTGPTTANDGKDDAWSDDELRSTIAAYRAILDAEQAGKHVNKAQTYRRLSSQFHRSPKAFERRMQNISAILDAWSVPWIEGLKPLKNIGANVRPRIALLLREGFKEVARHTAPYEEEVVAKLSQPLPAAPAGKSKPVQATKAVQLFVRDLAVKAWVLKYANGACECCGELAPFKTVDGIPFLEVHHLKTLASGGSDTVSNAIAVCPNCHRRLHYSDDAGDLRRKLLSSVGRLKEE